MTYAEFLATLAAARPPAGLSALLTALWLERKGDWHGAHAMAQEIDTADGARLHAYLHRKQGDWSNARYWYGRAGVTPAQGTLDAEWERLVRDFLSPGSSRQATR